MECCRNLRSLKYELPNIISKCFLRLKTTYCLVLFSFLTFEIILPQFTALETFDKIDVNTENYPKYSSLLNLVERWHPYDTEAPRFYEDGLAKFNFSNDSERKLAKSYRDAELPFKIYNIPLLDAATKRWTDDYLKLKLGSRKYTFEISKTNHFLFWKNTSFSDPSYEPPTSFTEMSFQDWLDYTQTFNSQNTNSSNTNYFYFYIDYQRSDFKKIFIVKDLPFLCPPRKRNFFVTNINANRGLECRFAMKKIIAESHYDAGRNMVAMVKGNRRYILNPPFACHKLGLITDENHPSYRQSQIDFSSTLHAQQYDFRNIPAVETILRTGEVLYIPSFWFHYIVSLDYSIQCNSRSGTPPREQGKNDVEKCLGTSLDYGKYDSAVV